VVGSDRRSDIGDMGNLPYVNVVIYEILRWRPITPLGIPHAVTQDDEYTGFHIPRGTMLLANN
jgi:cytochrome P450